jgi:glycogen phosphorylase
MKPDGKKLLPPGQSKKPFDMSRQKSAPADSVSTIQEAVRRHVKYALGKAWRDLSAKDLFAAVALSVRDQLVERMLETEERYRQKDPKRLYYLSIEFLIGQSLGNNLHNLGMRELYRQALKNPGVNLEGVEQSEEDAALGNGCAHELHRYFALSIAVKVLADTAKQPVTVYAKQQTRIGMLVKRAEELEKAKGE